MATKIVHSVNALEELMKVGVSAVFDISDCSSILLLVCLEQGDFNALLSDLADLQALKGAGDWEAVENLDDKLNEKYSLFMEWEDISLATQIFPATPESWSAELSCLGAQERLNAIIVVVDSCKALKKEIRRAKHNLGV